MAAARNGCSPITLCTTVVRQASSAPLMRERHVKEPWTSRASTRTLRGIVATDSCRIFLRRLIPARPLSAIGQQLMSSIPAAPIRLSLSLALVAGCGGRTALEQACAGSSVGCESIASTAQVGSYSLPSGGQSAATGAGGSVGGASYYQGGYSGTGGASASTSLYQGGLSSTGGTASTDTSSSVSAKNNCPLVTPNWSVYFLGDANSPCPSNLPATESACNSTSLQSAGCVFPTDQQLQTQSVCDCYVNTLDNTKPSAYWYCDEQLCKRRGDSCFLGMTPEQPASAAIQLATSCDARPLTACPAASYVTAQAAMDSIVTDVLEGCGVGFCGFGAILTVNFEAGCAKSFVLFDGGYQYNLVTDPTDGLAQCVAQKLQAVTYDCALELVCAAGEPPVSDIC